MRLPLASWLPEGAPSAVLLGVHPASSCADCAGFGELEGTIPRAAIDDLAFRLGDRCALRIFPERHHLLLHEADADEVFDECLR